MPTLINTQAELRLALQAAYARAGYMPLREMERRARHGRLPTSTVSRMLRGVTMFSSSQLQTFLEVCNVPHKEHGDWMEAWHRAQSARAHRATRELAEAVKPRRRVIEFDGYRSFFAQPNTPFRATPFPRSRPREEDQRHQQRGGDLPLRRPAGPAAPR
ncbi:hypothetical protein ABT119_35405 [Streptomyces sp. NPDC001910]|uniref:hypothetical protein n=1 Tax=Streptomyces sp. NPDC001910 TaxID=3154403 RepID=UPI0033304E57